MLDYSLGFENICDQNQAIWLLKTFLKKGNIPHAHLFTGIDGVGKRTTAIIFAMACLCESSRDDLKEPFFQSSADSPSIRPNRPCTQCRSCRRVASGHHPDVIRIDPDGAFIRIGQIRSLCATLTMRPYENGFRIVLIANAHQMNPEASNALLKVLEEPPDKTILILTASATSELLPTIVSRCQRLQFNPLSLHTIERILKEKKQLPSDSAKIIATMANGSISKAFELIQTNFIAYRKWLVGESVLGLMAAKKIPAWQGLAVAETLFKHKAYLDDSLEMIKSCLRDILIYPYAPNRIINRDMTEAIEMISQTVSVGQILEKLKAVEHAQKLISANGNLRLTLEIMAMRLSRSNA